MCSIQALIRPSEVPFQRRFNYSKADWENYAKRIDEALLNLKPEPQSYSQFVQIVASASRRYIPRGCRTSYISGLSQESARLLDQYETLYNNDPFAEDTIQMGEELMTQICVNRQEKWMNTINSIDLTHNSKKAWSTIRKLTSNHPIATARQSQVTANQVAHQLLVNGKPSLPSKRTPKTPSHSSNANNSISYPFDLTEITSAIKAMKSGKASGVDNIATEQIQHFGPTAVSWLLRLFNSCMESAKIPSLWRKSKTIAVLKPGKTPDEPKNFRPISLLCHSFKLLERMLLNRLSKVVDAKLIPEQAGFRPGKSCCSQVLNLTQHIENGFEAGEITGVVFVDLSAAYDTINIRRLLWKVENVTGDNKFVRVLSEFLRNRMFQVHMLSEKSRWRHQKNGLPQGSVLAPTLFNIYTNDQPAVPHTKRFIYADDLALATRTKTFEQAEANLSAALLVLGAYYDENSLKANPAKTQSCAFHLRNRHANRVLDISWRGTTITHCSHPKYLGVTLDRALTFKINCENIKQKVSARNNLLLRLTSSKWGATPSVLRTTGLALCYSAGEYACPVWYRSAHAKKVDTALHKTCRQITGCLKPTPLKMLYPLAGIAPPAVRREVAATIEKLKQETDPRHPLFGHIPATKRLKSRYSFLQTPSASDNNGLKARETLWRDKFSLPNFIPAAEKLPPGHKLPWPTWKALNRLRTQVGRSKNNMARWGYIHPTADKCDCGVPQTMNHLLSCTTSPASCTMQDLYLARPNAVRVAEHWAKCV